MKSNLVKKLILVVLAIVIALSTINKYNIIDDYRNNDGTIGIREKTNLKNPKLSGWYIESFIHIDDNWTETLIKPWCNFVDGFYVIENVTIDASSSPTGHGILINNSQTDDFIINNCTVYDAGGWWNNAGIKLENTNNGILTSNNFSVNNSMGIALYNTNNTNISGNTANYNNEHGIYLRYCYNNTISGNNASYNIDEHGIYLRYCYNNTISGNNASYNIDGYGIYLDHCYNNTISGNNATNNYDGGITISNGDNSTISGNILNKSGKYGIYLGYTFHVNISGNQMKECGIVIYGWDAHLTSHIIYTDNTVNGKPVYYYYDKKGLGANNFTGAGQVILANCNDSIISNLDTSSTSIGIFLCRGSNNIISGNNVSNNNINGIRSLVLYNNTISGNTINNNGEKGMLVIGNNNTISGNTINDNGYHGIQMGTSNNNIISGNTVIGNKWDGMNLMDYCNNNTISGNILNENDNGLYLYGGECDNNIILGNIASNNTNRGLFFQIGNNNTVSENIVYENNYGIQISSGSDDNLIFFNALFNNTISNANDDGQNAWDNGVSGNYWGDYSGIDADYDGIGDTPYNVPGGGGNKDNKPIMNNYLFFVIHLDDINYEVGTEGHTFKWKVINLSPTPLSFNVFRDGTPIKTGKLFSVLNEVPMNVDSLDLDKYSFAIEINDGDGRTVMDSVWVTVNNTKPVFTATPNDFSHEVGETGKSLSWTFSDVSTNNSTYTITRNSLPLSIVQPCISGEIIEISVDGLNIGSYCYAIEINDGYDGIVQDSAWVTVINTLPVFTLKPNDTSYEVGETRHNLSWTFSDISTNNPTYTITRNSLPLIIDNPCISGEAINISADGLDTGSYCFEIEVDDGYGGIIMDSAWVTVISCSNLLFVEIIDQSFSLEEFNITFIIYNESSQGIDSATIKMWWNGINVSANFQNLGDGIYFISLGPITVAPGEDPILLKMAISASGYEDKDFETYIAVDPDTLEKGPAEFPLLILIIAITSIAGGVGVAGVALFLLRKRKRISELT